MEKITNLINRDVTPLIRKAQIFSSLTDKEVDFLAQYSDLYSFVQHEELYSSGTSGAELFVIESGGVKIIRSDDRGEQITVARFVAGECFGELDLLAMARRSETAVTEKNSVILIFPHRDTAFTELLSFNPGLSNSILIKLMSTVASRIRGANAKIRENSPWIQELRRKVYTDSRTGLPNRTYLEDNLKEFLTSKGCNLLMFKPDNFKQINDSFGHKAGDAAIEEIGEFFSGIVKDSEIAVRYMSNEYALIIPECSLKNAKTRAEEIQKLQSCIDYRKSTGGTTMNVSVSVGIARYPDHADNGSRIIALAHEYAMMGRMKGGSRILIPESAETPP